MWKCTTADGASPCMREPSASGTAAPLTMTTLNPHLKPPEAWNYSDLLMDEQFLVSLADKVLRRRGPGVVRIAKIGTTPCNAVVSRPKCSGNFVFDPAQVVTHLAKERAKRSSLFDRARRVPAVLPICEPAPFESLRCSGTSRSATMHPASSIVHGGTSTWHSFPCFRAASRSFGRVAWRIAVLQPSATRVDWIEIRGFHSSASSCCAFSPTLTEPTIAFPPS